MHLYPTSFLLTGVAIICNAKVSRNTKTLQLNLTCIMLEQNLNNFHVSDAEILRSDRVDEQNVFVSGLTRYHYADPYDFRFYIDEERNVVENAPPLVKLSQLSADVGFNYGNVQAHRS